MCPVSELEIVHPEADCFREMDHTLNGDQSGMDAFRGSSTGPNPQNKCHTVIKA